jgi:cytochrome c oxidase subunit 2
MWGWPPPVLDPAGPYATPVVVLSWALAAMAVLVMAVVGVCLALALVGGPSWRARVGGERAVLIGGIGFPVVVLSLLLIWGLSLTARLTHDPDPDALRIRVSGEMWWWRVDYPAPGGGTFASANEIRIPVGRPVVIEAVSGDVIHSIWIPRLGGKIDMIPGRTNLLRLQADAPGVYRGQCAEFCGGPHALMGLEVVAMEPAAYDAWVARMALPPPPPTDPFLLRGQAVFEANGCGACHTVRGTSANGLAGPDLSDVGGRGRLGAGILPNNRGTLAGWTSNPQAIKPGVRMPVYDTLSGGDLHALAAWLESRR